MKNEYIAPFGYTGTCDSELFLKWVQEMFVQNLKKNQIVILLHNLIFIKKFGKALATGDFGLLMVDLGCKTGV